MQEAEKFLTDLVLGQRSPKFITILIVIKKNYYFYISGPI